MFTRYMLLGVAAMVGVIQVRADEPMGSGSIDVAGTRPATMVSPSVENEGRQALARALDWLAAKQAETGGWSSDKFPAITALALEGFIGSEHPQRDAVVQKAVECLKAYVRADGGIYRAAPGPDEGGSKGGGLSNYNTAICLAILGELHDASLSEVLLNARAFLERSQHKGDDVFKGGFGYDQTTGRAYTDMMNTYYAADAMSRTAWMEEFRSGDRVDIDWNGVGDYVTRMQNTESAGADDAGGLFYNPVDPKAGSLTNAAGVIVFRSYGSITYAGLMQLLYARVDRADPRVKSAFHWASRHWTLDENPGMGAEGLYFYYDILSKCMNAYGHDAFTMPDGTVVGWREALISKLVSMQKIEADTGHGYWVNEKNRYMEGDPVLVTAYSIMALRQALE